jgi:kynurenine formamidase
MSWSFEVLATKNLAWYPVPKRWASEVDAARAARTTRERQSELIRRSHIAAQVERHGLENLANVDQLPPVGAWIIALPMKIAGGSGGPLRAIALVPASGKQP